MNVNKKKLEKLKKINYNVMEKLFYYKQRKWCRHDCKRKNIKNLKLKKELDYNVMWMNFIKNKRKMKKIIIYKVMEKPFSVDMRNRVVVIEEKKI